MNQTPAPTTRADAPIVTEDPQAEDGCPVPHDRAPHPTQGGGDRQWWPNSLNLKVLAKNPAHCDMGPTVRYLGADVPTEVLIWQDPLLKAPATTLAEADIAAPKRQMAAFGLTVAQPISTAWAAASSFRGRDKRGGTTGARIRLEPPRSWEVNVHMLAGMP